MNRLFFLMILLLASAAVQAQGTVDDYKRAYSIRHKYNNKVKGNVVAHLYYGNNKQDTHMWCSTFNGDSTVYYDVNIAMGESYGEHKGYDFFVKHLLKKDPPAWDKLKR